MPGLLSKLHVAKGDKVSAGQKLAVIEAMKMENVIRAPRTGVIAEVQAQVGVAVEKAAVLVTYEMNE